MSYWKYKPVNKRFTEFVAILLTTAGCAFIGVLLAIVRLGGDISELTFDQQTMGPILTYAIPGAILGLILGAVIVNSSRESGE